MAGPIVLERDLLHSEAFRTLPLAAMLILLDFMGKRRIKTRKLSNGSRDVDILNNGEITYYFSEAEKKGVTRSRFNRARDTLVDRGFIDIAHHGSGGKKGDATLYAISDRWRHWGTDKFIRKERPKDTRKGVGFARHWAKKK